MQNIKEILSKHFPTCPFSFSVFFCSHIFLFCCKDTLFCLKLQVFFNKNTILLFYILYIIRCKGKKNGEIPRLWYMKCYSCGIGGMKKKSYLCIVKIKTKY